MSQPGDDSEHSLASLLNAHCQFQSPSMTETSSWNNRFWKRFGNSLTPTDDWYQVTPNSLISDDIRIKPQMGLAMSPAPKLGQHPNSNTEFMYFQTAMNLLDETGEMAGKLKELIKISKTGVRVDDWALIPGLFSLSEPHKRRGYYKAREQIVCLIRTKFRNVPQTEAINNLIQLGHQVIEYRSAQQQEWKKMQGKRYFNRNVYDSHNHVIYEWTEHVKKLEKCRDAKRK